MWSSIKYAEWLPHLLVFPEYSIPLQVLPDLKKIASKHSMIIVAASHRVYLDNEAKSIYDSLGIPSDSLETGNSIAPIFLGDGRIENVFRLNKSVRDQDIIVPDNPVPQIINAGCRDISINLAVLLCIDSLKQDMIGACYKDDNSPNIIVCPSLSFQTQPFIDVGKTLPKSETLYCYVNTASHGDTHFSLPEAWNPYLAGPKNLLSQNSVVKELSH